MPSLISRDSKKIPIFKVINIKNQIFVDKSYPEIFAIINNCDTIDAVSDSKCFLRGVLMTLEGY
jgi:hypothetical protein